MVEISQRFENRGRNWGTVFVEWPIKNGTLPRGFISHPGKRGKDLLLSREEKVPAVNFLNYSILSLLMSHVKYSASACFMFHSIA